MARAVFCGQMLCLSPTKIVLFPKKGKPCGRIAPISTDRGAPASDRGLCHCDAVPETAAQRSHDAEQVMPHAAPRQSAPPPVAQDAQKPETQQGDYHPINRFGMDRQIVGSLAPHLPKVP